MASVLLTVDRDRVSVAPGSSVEFAVSVQNLTSLLDQVALRVEGLDPAWVQIVPPVLPVFAQGVASARVIVRPPAAPAQSLAGAYELRVAGASQERAGEEASATLVLDVQLVGDYQIGLSAGQPGTAPQELRFPLRVQNSANAPLQLRLTGSDRAEALWYKFEPFVLSVPAGAQGSSILTARIKQLTAAKQTLPFAVHGAANYLLRDNSTVEAPAREVAAQFVQGALHALMVSLAPQQSAAAQTTTVRVRVGNPGTIPVAVTLRAASDDAALTFQIDPGQLKLGPQAEQQASLLIRSAVPPNSEGAGRSFTYRVSAEAADGLALPSSAEGRFQQIPEAKPFPWALVIGIGILLLMILFGIILLMIGTIGR